MRLNNKGFAISGILYPIFILFIVLILGAVGNLATSKAILDRANREIELELNGDDINPKIYFQGDDITVNTGYVFSPMDDVTAYDYDNKKIGNDKISYTSSPTYSYDVNGIYNITYTATDSRGRATIKTRVIRVEAAPIYTLSYNGSAQDFPGNLGGVYKVELWGASGGNSKYNIDGTGATVYGGNGAYTSGIISVPSNSNLKLFLGGEGGNSALATAGLGGYNGGALGGSNSQAGGGGGGASDLRAMPTNRYRYVKDYLNGSSSNTGNHWVEIQVYDKEGNNVALNKPVTSSIAMSNLAYLNNDDTTTANYVGGGTGNQSVEIDLGAEYEIDYVKVYHYYGDGRTYNATKTILYNESRSTSLEIFDSLWSGTYAETGSGVIRSVLNWNYFDSLKSRIMVAAGGAGASNWQNATTGGYGGAVTGGPGYLNAGSAAHTLAGGGTQTAGGTAGLAASPGKFALGGNSDVSHGGGGGGGYYGGGGGGIISSGVSSGAGGSSFVSGASGYNAITSGSSTAGIIASGQANHYSNFVFSNTSIVAGNASMPNPFSGTMTGNASYGYARITSYIKVNS